MLDTEKELGADAAAYILQLDADGEGTPLPMALEGLPAVDDAGQPIHYRRVRVAVCGHWTHRGTGEPLDITPDRADQWVRNTAARAAAGVYPFVPTVHNFGACDARDNLGRVVRLSRDGSDVFAVVALHGDEALKIAARNGRSIGIVRDARDAAGNVYPGETLHHLALTPNPALPDLGGMVRVAASADVALTVPVYQCDLTTGQKGLVVCKDPRGNDDFTDHRYCVSMPSTTLSCDGGLHSYATTQVDLPPELSGKVKLLGDSIPDEDLAEGGRASDPHITVKYGLHHDSAARVKAALKDQMPPRFDLGPLDVFPATADRPSDVLVARVHSPDLEHLHRVVGTASPHVDTHAEYRPHVTIAYLKPGRGAKYAGRSDLAGMRGQADSVIHSSRDGGRTEIPLTSRSQTQSLSLSAGAGGNNPSASATSRRSYKMRPEIAASVRQKLGFGADVADDQLDDKTAERALALSADVQRLTDELEAKSREVLALSAGVPRKLDPVTLAMYGENIAAKRELAVRAGFPESAARLIDSLILDADGRPTPLALSASGPARKPAGFEIWDVLAKAISGAPIVTGTAQRGDETQATAAALSLSGDPARGNGNEPQGNPLLDTAKAMRGIK